VPALLDHFLTLCARKERVPVPHVSPDAVAVLQQYDWPGNVRELRNVAERLIVRAWGGQAITPAELPVEIGRRRVEPAGPPRPGQPRLTSALLDQMLKQGESFWSVVHRPVMARDLTRAEVGALVAEGLELTKGSYKQLVKLFNIPPSDYKPFLSFLRKHDCHVPFQRYRRPGTAASRTTEVGAEQA
jgi:DNA-binding NtrC family response regulator